MACTYTLLSNSKDGNVVLDGVDVTTLDTYLMEKLDYFDPSKEFYKLYGDIVFSESHLQDTYLKKIDENHKLYKLLVKTGKIVIDGVGVGEDESLDGVTSKVSTHMGTTKFIRSIKILDPVTEERRPLFPIFEKDNYWNERKKDLANAVRIITNNETRNEHPIFSKYDIETIFKKCSPHDVGAVQVPLLGSDAYYQIHDITNDEELEKIRHRLMDTKADDDHSGVWELLGNAGTAIHNAMEIFFREECWKMSDIDAAKVIKGELKDPDLRWLLNGSTIKDIVTTAKKLYETICRPENFGKNCRIIPERGVTTTGILTDENGKTTTNVTGKLDLLVIGEDGKTGIIDYKCSLKAYNENDSLFEPGFNEAKINTFKYLLGTYERILHRIGINLGITKWVVPLQMNNYHIDKDTDELSFSGISTENTLYDEIVLSDVAKDHLNELFPEETIDDVTLQELGPAVENFLRKAFPNYFKYRYTPLTEEEIDKIIELTGGYITGDDKTHIKVFGTYYEGKNEAEVRSKVIDDILKRKNVALRTLDRTREFKTALKTAIATGSFDMKIHKSAKAANGSNSKPMWLQSYFSKYANERYKILEGEDLDVLDNYGIVLIRNKASGNIDVLKVSLAHHNLKHRHLLGGEKLNRKYILGTFLSDTLSYNSTDSPVLESTLGNIELMESMVVINSLLNYFKDHNALVGEIFVCNPDTLDLITASNKLLLYNYSRLASFTKSSNNFAYNEKTTDKILMLTFTQKISDKLKDLNRRAIFSRSYLSGMEHFYDNSYISKVDLFTLDKSTLLSNLNQLRLELEENFPLLKRISSIDLTTDLEHPEIPLYNNILYAISELNGVDLNLLIFDHDNWMEASFKNILTEGLNGNLTDNPGTLKSATLNKLALLTELAYLNCRLDVLVYLLKLTDEVTELKNSKNFGWIQKVTFGNQTNLYLKFYNPDIKDDLVFMNPFSSKAISTFSNVEMKFLKNTLIDILSKRKKFAKYGDLTKDENLKAAIDEEEDALLVPLVRASTASLRAVGGWLHTFRDRLKRFSSWSRIKTTVKEAILGTLKDEETNAIESSEMYEMVNRFESSFDPLRRRELLEDHLMQNPDNSKERIVDLSYWEHNVEAIRLGHKVAISMKTHLDKVFPMLKAIVMHLNFSGIIQNDNFEHDLNYAVNYIKNKIFNIPIENIEKWGKFKVLAGAIMGEASKISLAFNVKSLYLSIDGLWKDMMLVILKPDGTMSFTKKNMTDSFFWIYKDLGHVGDQWSLGEYLNLQYGINDLDVNNLSEKISKDNAGIHNFWSFGFRFASRPDYYNRMTIFGAQMRADKTFEAYVLDKDGKWKYDFKKDGRFQHLINEETTHPDYEKEKALYITMMEDFINELATYEDGTPVTRFNIEKGKPIPPLPRAYTTRLSESMKALGDKIYGYYSHEKRSMMQAYTLGSLFWQMNTFWSSKKNLYISGRTFTLLGNYKLYEEPEVDEEGNIIMEGNLPKMQKYYSRIDTLGNVVPIAEKDLAPGEAKVPYMVWKGRPLEGIIVTAANLFKDAFLNENGDYNLDMKRIAKVITPHSEYWESLDPEVRNLYNANLRLLLYDLIMFLLLGTLVAPSLLSGVEDYTKETGNSTISSAFKNNCLLTFCSMFDLSTDDFNWVKSIGGRGKDWTPFAISSINRIFSNMGNALGGSKDFYDATVNSIGAFRTNKSLLDYVKLSSFGVNIGTNMNNTEE